MKAIYDLPQQMELAAKRLGEILEGFEMDVTVKNPTETLAHFGHGNETWSLIATGGPDDWGDCVSGGVNPFGEYLSPLVPFLKDDWHMETWGGYDVMFFGNEEMEVSQR